MAYKVDWHGCYTAVVTPFKENGDLDIDAFNQNIELLIGEGVDGLIVCGCTGESWVLTDEERKELFRIGAETARNRIIMLGGTGQISARATIEMGRHAREVGLDGIMVLPPQLALPGEREILHYYTKISDGVDIPVLIYNNPRRQGVDLTPGLVDRLADLDQVAAIKESSKDFGRVAEIIRRVGGRIKVFAGHSSMQGVSAIVMGADGWVGSLDTQLLGKDAISMYRLLKAGRIDEARRIQYRCIAAEEAMKGKNVGTFPASLKYAMNLCGRPGGFTREPILAPTEEQKAVIEDVVRRLGLI